MKTNEDIENCQRNLWHNAKKAEIVDTGGDERKGAYDSILTAINFWDQDITFTGEKMAENKLI